MHALMNEDEVYTHNEAAKKLKVSRSTILRMVKEGDLEQIRIGERPNPDKPGQMIRGSPRIPAISIRNYIARQLGYSAADTGVRAQPKEVTQWPKFTHGTTAAISGQGSKAPGVSGLDALLKSRRNRS